MYVQKRPMFSKLEARGAWTRPKGCRITENITPWLVAGMFVLVCSPRRADAMHDPDWAGGDGVVIVPDRQILHAARK